MGGELDAKRKARMERFGEAEVKTDAKRSVSIVKNKNRRKDKMKQKQQQQGNGNGNGNGGGGKKNRDRGNKGTKRFKKN